MRPGWGKSPPGNKGQTIFCKSSEGPAGTRGYSMNDNTIKSYKQGPKQAEPTATPVTYASLTDAINANPTEWAELDIKNGCFPIFGREIEPPVIGNAYPLMVQGYMCELVEIAIFTNYLLHCSNTRIFFESGRTILLLIFRRA